MSDFQLVSETEEDTVETGRALGEVLSVGDAVLLYGEMGAGKTCMTRGIALGAECEVSARSPTFIILAEYPGRVRIFHCDLYRVVGPAEIHELALDETIDQGALVVEWPENGAGALPEDALEVRIKMEPLSGVRKISMTGCGPKSRSLLDRFTRSAKVTDKR